MKKSDTKKTALLAVTLSTILLSSLNAADISAVNTGKLNFVFVLIDDMGWTDLGCFGSSFYETPKPRKRRN